MAVFSSMLLQRSFCVLFPNLDMGAILVGLSFRISQFPLMKNLPITSKDLPLDENIKVRLLEYKGNLRRVF